MKNIFLAIVIHVIVPLIGLLFFLFLRKKIKEERVADPPIAEFFILFATYGGLLIVAITTLFWQWSGLASLGSLYLVLIAPFIMIFLAYRMKNNKIISIYHELIYYLSTSYFIIAPLTFLILFLISDK
ncbi:hypothetical protein [uncultured Flavobacterium sp.]|uniref:hypothetical protein n=1 Tax=uncultured Flavobacterium sp. TaxID=165435 RepID=UPI0030EEE26F|tara:strand:- start:15533 stop:15916 length:384 start_codon:yes stop_codon:yes gene_type:complete